MNFRAVLVAFCGDTPASNYIDGFKEGVGGAYRGCRECIATKPEMETMLLHEECPLRDEMSHTQQCRSLENLTGKEFAEASKISGVNFLSPLHDVPHFQVTKCFPQDAMHVLLEGVVPHVFTLFLRYALDKKYFTLSELNSQIEPFHYNYHEIKDKPSPIQKEAIQGTKIIGQYACQMWLFAILLPVLIASTIPVSDPNWICFGTLLKILAICMCRKIYHRMIPIVTELIKDHHEQFLVLYPGRMVTFWFIFLT